MKKTLIIDSLKKAITYSTYKTLIKGLLVEGKSTGLVQSENLTNFSMLNDRRMDRLDKTLKITEETQNYLDKISNHFTFLTISEGWCGDAAQILPVLNKLSEASSKIDLKIVCRDENEALMQKFLTNGSKSIPKVVILDSNNEVVNTWGPRPSVATKMVLDYKEKNGSIDAEFKKELQLWYNKDKGKSTQQDLIEVLETSLVTA